MDEAPIFELHVKPTYAVCIPQRKKHGRPKSLAQMDNEKNLKENSTKGVISAKARQRITNAVNWLVASAKDKTIYCRKSNKRFNFRVNFVTLTLPCLDHGITDHFFKSVMLHAFINTCRYKYGMQNFIWKVEAQENGNIHAHFTTDVYIHWAELRKVWNRILSKNGIIDLYQKKHQGMTFETYYSYYSFGGKKSAESLRKAFDSGVAENWTQPNSTDVHSVKSVKNLGAYLAKYLGKNDKERRVISGRVWSCSYNLSESNKLIVEMSHQDDFEYMGCLMNPDVKYKVITACSGALKKTFTVGEIFFYKLSDWGRSIRGKLLDLYNNHRHNIRTGVDIQALKAFLKPPAIDPYVFTADIDFSPGFSQSVCPF